MVDFTWEKLDNTGTSSGAFTTLDWGNHTLGATLGQQIAFTANADLADVRMWVSDALSDNATPANWMSATTNSFRSSLYDYGSSSASMSQADLNTSATDLGAYLSSTDPGAGSPNINSGSTITSGTAYYLLLGVYPETDVTLGTHDGIVYAISYSYS